MTGPVYTFDDGPSEWTGAILDLLAEYGQQAAFFITGQNVFGRSELVQRAFEDGHIVGNHGWSHKRLTELPDVEIAVEIGATSALLEMLTDSKPSVFRAPYFATDDRVNAIAASYDLTHMGANLVPDDWSATDPEALARTVLAELKPYSVVSLHDGIPPDGGSSTCTDSRAVTVEALRMILETIAVKA